MPAAAWGRRRGGSFRSMSSWRRRVQVRENAFTAVRASLIKKTTSLEHYTINSLAPFCTLSQGGGLPRSDRPCVPCFRCCPSGRGRPCRAPVLLRTLSTAAAATGRRSAAHLTTIASSTAPMIVQLRHGLCTYAAYVPCVEHSTPLPPQHCREGRAPRGSRRKPSYPRSPLLLDARALRARARAACSTSSSGR